MSGDFSNRGEFGYRIELDRDDDGQFATDLSMAVSAVTWRLGMAAAGERMAEAAWAAVQLRNESRALSPEVSKLPLTPGLGFRIRYVDEEGHSTPLFVGQIARNEPETGSHGKRRATLYAEDAQQALRENEIHLPTQESARADEIIAAILAHLPLRRPALAGHAILGLAGHNALGETTRLFSVAAVPQSFQRGRSRFELVNERWLAGISAWEAIRRIVNSERGRFYFDRRGRAVFLQRHHLLRQTEPTTHLRENAATLEYRHGDSIINEWQVRLQPRRRGEPGTALWSTQRPLRLDGHAELRLRVHFRDELGRRVAALRVDAPRAGKDYRATRDAAGKGQDVTTLIAVLLLERAADSALLSLRNLAPQPLFVQLSLRGTPIWEEAPLTVVARDGRSMARFGRRPQTLEHLALNDAEVAHQLACFELAQSTEMRGVFRSITLNQREQLPLILQHSLFDAVRITDEQSGHSAAYCIVAEEHEVTHGGQRHQCRWWLEPAHTAHFATLGSSRLADEPLLAY